MFSFQNLQMVVTVVLLIMAAACSLFQEEVQVPQTVELRIDHPGTGPAHFSVLQGVDTNTRALQEFASDLASFSIRGITYTARGFEGSQDAVVSGVIEFARSGSNDFTVLDTITDLHLGKLEESGQKNTILLQDEAVRRKLTDLLQRGSTITFRLNGTTATNNPIAANLLLTIDTQMTVEL